MTTTSIISPRARLGRNVTVGHFCRIGDHVVIGDNTRIGDYCTIGESAGGKWSGCDLRIGANSTIRSHTVIYEGSEFGPKLETGHHVLIREGTCAGENLRLGSFSDIEGDCRLGDYVRLHGYVHVGRGSAIGHFVWLYSLTTLTNDPLPPSHASAPVEIEDGVVVCVGATLMPGVVLRRGCFVSAQACARGDCPAGAVIDGPEGRIVSHVSLLRDLANGVQHPWMHHFHDAYPAECRPRLRSLAESIRADREAFLQHHVLH